MARRQLWWAQGQLGALRIYCMNLARLRQDLSDPSVGDEPYFKVEQTIPSEQLSPLQPTYCAMEQDEMLQVSLAIVQYYRELALPLARKHGITYPADLDRAIYGRLEKLLNER